MCGSLVGKLLPFQLVYGGNTNRCHPSKKFPMDWQIVHTENHWSNEQTMIKYIDDIIVPFVNWKRDELGLEGNHPALAIFDHFKGQLTDEIRKCLEYIITTFTQSLYQLHILASCNRWTFRSIRW